MALTLTVELPAVYLDPLTTVDAVASRLQLINRNPEPGELEVPLVYDIELTICDTDAATPGVDLASTFIYVDGVLAYDGAGSGFQTGFDGVDSAVTAVGTNQQRILFDVVAPFVSQTVVSVRVVSACSTGPGTLDETYSFTIVDRTTPQVVQVVASGHRTVRVTFDEDVTMLDTAGSSDALNPANYSILPSTAPAVTPTVLSVAVVSGRTVELALNMELTQGAIYLLVVTNVTDSSGNIVTAPTNQGGFAGYSCPVPAGRSFDLFGMLPLMNRREDLEGTGDLRKFISCIQEIVDLLLCDIDAFSNTLDPDTADEQYVDAMLEDLGNPFNFDLTLENKRRLVLILVPLYQQKGTSVGIANAVRFFLGFEVTITAFNSDTLTLGESELGDTDGDPAGDWILGPAGSFELYCFDVTVDQVLTDAERVQLRALVNYMKPAHTHFINLIEPTVPEVIDHVELGLSVLDDEFILH